MRTCNVHEKPKPGWDREGDHCYFWSEERKKWFDAEDTCISIGGHLPSIDTWDINNCMMGKRFLSGLELRTWAKRGKRRKSWGRSSERWKAMKRIEIAGLLIQAEPHRTTMCHCFQSGIFKCLHPINISIFCLSVNVLKSWWFLIQGLIGFHQAYSDFYLSKQDKDLSPKSISIMDFLLTANLGIRKLWPF